MWNDVLKTFLAVIASAGGCGAIAVLFVKFCGNMIAKKLSEKYELKLNKELEKYKMSLDNKNYITKTCFDYEFLVYKELTSKFFSMIEEITALIPLNGKYPVDENEKEKYENQIYDRAKGNMIIAQNCLYSNIPFVSLELYEKYTSILKLCSLQISAFERRFNVLYFGDYKYCFKDEEYKRTAEILKSYESLCLEVRNYLHNLVII